MQPTFKRTVLASFISAALSAPFSAYANTPQEVKLNTVIVSATPFSQQMGTQKITEKEIARRPTNNGSVTDLLKYNPNVQFSNKSGLSANAGEIKPDNISFHGEKFYNNNFMVDGISNNSNINPDSRTETGDVPGYQPWDLPSDNPQSFFLDSSLYKSVEVFDSNISAKYGQFTGGVVDARLKDPMLDRPTGKIFYRTSRSAWDKFHWQDNEQKKGEGIDPDTGTIVARPNYYQPEYKKQQYGVIASQPLSDKAALMFSYTRTESDIPYYHNYMKAWEDQRRINETYYLRGIYLPDNGDLWKATAIYSPHREKYLKSDVKNGAFTNTGGGFRTNLEWEKDLSWAKMKSYVGYQRTENEIEHEGNNRYEYLLTPSINWCSTKRCDTRGRAYEGGFGTYSTIKRTFTFKQDYEINKFDLFNTEHALQFGWQIDLSKAKYNRKNDTIDYSSPTLTTLTNCSECISGEQYLGGKTVRPSRSVSANDSQYAFYLQDNIRWKNLEVTPGIRVDYNKTLRNVDIAPRFSISYDIFGDHNTVLFGGVNRYYSNSILAYKLRQGIGRADSYSRYSETGNWIKTSQNSFTGNYYRLSTLDTPYSDEYVLGLSQTILDTIWTLKWVNRHSKDQFVTKTTSEIVNGYYTNPRRPRPTPVKTLTNDGKGETNTFTLTIDPKSNYKFKYAELDWKVGAQISSSKSNLSTYDAAALDNDIREKVIWDGKMRDLSDLPALDYNNQWSAFLEFNTYFPSLNLNWDQRFSYSNGFKSYNRTSRTCPTYGAACGGYTGQVYEYTVENNKDAFVWDWRFAYKLPLSGTQFVELTLDVNNVLNAKVASASFDGSTTSSGNSYKLGRNYWLGISYNW